MSKYKKKPVIIEAFKWTGDINQTEEPDWIVRAIMNGTVFFPNKETEEVKLCINTLEGTMTANRGDYIIQGINGELYPCKPDIFDKTYEVIE